MAVPPDPDSTELRIERTPLQHFQSYVVPSKISKTVIPKNLRGS